VRFAKHWRISNTLEGDLVCVSHAARRRGEFMRERWILGEKHARACAKIDPEKQNDAGQFDRSRLMSIVASRRDAEARLSHAGLGLARSGEGDVARDLRNGCRAA